MKQSDHTVFGESFFVKGCMKAAMTVLFACLLILFVHGFSVMDQADFADAFLAAKWKKTAIFLAFSFVCMLLFLIRRVLGILGKRQLNLLSVLLFLGMTVCQCAFLLYFRSMYLWDEAFIVGGATSLAGTGSIAQDAYYYLSVYPNQHPFVVVTAALLALAGKLSLQKAGQYLLLNLAGTFCLDVAIVFLVKCQTYLYRSFDKRIQAEKRCYLLCLICLNPFVYVFAAYYYTIPLSLPFFMGGIYYALKVLSGNRRYALFSGLLFGIGYAVRPTTVIPVIACVLTGVFVALFRKEAGRFGYSVMIAVVSLAAGLFLLKGAQHLVGIDTTDTAFPATHWLMMSLTSPGNHNEEDEAFTAGFATKEEKKQAVSARLAQKLGNLGVRGYVHLLKDKFFYTWESGNHAYGFYTGNTLRTGWIYRWVYGSRRDVFALYGQGYYLFLLAGMLCVIWRFFIRQPDALSQRLVCPLFFFLLTILGGILFYLLWETGTQYALVFFPLFFLTASFAGGVGSGFGEKMASDVGKPDGMEPAATGAPVENTVSCLPGQGRKMPLYMVLGGLVFAVFTVWMWKQRTVFTAQPYDQSETRVLQILANTPYELKDGDVLVQQLKADRPFNKMIFQYRNFMTDRVNDSVYEVTLRGGRVCFKEQIVAEGQPLNGAFIKEFEQLMPGLYELEIKKCKGSSLSSLSFVTYQMDGYDAYTNGKLLLSGKPLENDMMIGLYQTSQGTYTTMTGYCGFWLVCFVCFLFWEICCILMGKCGIKG